jgi:hypothetical protein
MPEADDPSVAKRREREEKLAAALRANLRRRKAEPAKRAATGDGEKAPKR